MYWRLGTPVLNRLICSKAKQTALANSGRSLFVLIVDKCCLFCCLLFTPEKQQYIENT